MDTILWIDNVVAIFLLLLVRTSEVKCSKNWNPSFNTVPFSQRDFFPDTYRNRKYMSSLYSWIITFYPPMHKIAPAMKRYKLWFFLFGIWIQWTFYFGPDLTQKTFQLNMIKWKNCDNVFFLGRSLKMLSSKSDIKLGDSLHYNVSEVMCANEQWLPNRNSHLQNINFNFNLALSTAVTVQYD